MLFVNACCECVCFCVCVCACVCFCVCACVCVRVLRARTCVLKKSRSNNSFNHVEELLEALFFLCWSYEQLLGWGINMEWTQNKYK